MLCARIKSHLGNFNESALSVKNNKHLKSRLILQRQEKSYTYVSNINVQYLKCIRV